MRIQRNASRAARRLREDARRYYALCDRAERLGISASLDAPDAPQTVAALRAAVAKKQARR